MISRIVSNKLWGEIRKTAANCLTRRAAIAYVTSDTYIKFKRGDVLVVDASDAAIKSGETSAAVLRRAFKRKASIFSLPKLHAKCIVCDRTAIIGSANASVSSTQLYEAALITDDSLVVAEATALIEQMANAGEPVDEKFLRRIETIKVVRRGGRGASQGRNSPKVFNVKRSRTWVIGVSELSDDAFPEEEELAEEGQQVAESRLSARTYSASWVRFVGGSRFRREVATGDSVIQIWRPRGGKRGKVYRPVTVVHRQDEDSCTRIYLAEPANEEDYTIPLGEFRRLAKRVGISREIGLSSLRELNIEHAKAIDLLWPKD